MLNEILDTVRFLRDHAATKEDLEQRLTETKDEIMTRVDGFIVLHQRLDSELAALRYKCQRLETDLERVLHHLHLEPTV